MDANKRKWLLSGLLSDYTTTTTTTNNNNNNDNLAVILSCPTAEAKQEQENM